MNALEKIVLEKRIQVQADKISVPVEILEQSGYYKRECFSLKEFLLREDKSGIIAEIKKHSPVLGAINPGVNVEKLAGGYEQAGASALSVLTDKKFFGGCNADLIITREKVSCPILRKEFVVDEYQVIEGKSIGADAILLIASILSKEEIEKFTDLAHRLGMEVLLELHTERELEKVYEAVDVIGVNNRNLETMQIDIATSRSMAKLIPAGYIKISESGIEDPGMVIEIMQLGFNGVLIGSNFMKHPEPEIACAKFIQKINQLKNKTDAA